MIRSVFSTGTAKTAMFGAIAGALAAITPNVANIAERMLPERKADIADVEQIAIQVLGLASLLGGGLAIANRASATDKVYSPDWMPGFNQSDLEQQSTALRLPRPDMHEQVRELMQRSIPEGVALPPIDMGPRGKTLADLAAIAQEQN